jgi:hypothetical protein
MNTSYIVKSGAVGEKFKNREKVQRKLEPLESSKLKFAKKKLR